MWCEARAVVEDDVSLLTAFTTVLTGFHVSAARDMPSMTGEELLGHIRERHPRVKALIVTGHGTILDQEAPDWWTSEAHLTKPFDATTLRAAVANLVGPA